MCSSGGEWNSVCGAVVSGATVSGPASMGTLWASGQPCSPLSCRWREGLELAVWVEILELVQPSLLKITSGFPSLALVGVCGW